MIWTGLTLELVRTQKYFSQSLKIMKLPCQKCQKDWHLRRPNQDNLRYSFNQQSTHLGIMHMIDSLDPAISSVILTHRK